MKPQSARGYTLAEILTAVAVVGITAAVGIPTLSAFGTKRLEVAAEEVANAVRYSVKESQRTGRHVLVDAESVPGHLRVVYSNAAGTELDAVIDPLTKRALDVDVSGSPFSADVAVVPRFLQGGVPYGRLLIQPGGGLQVFDGTVARGPLQAGSGVALILNANSVTVAIDDVTGRVTWP